MPDACKAKEIPMIETITTPRPLVGQHAPAFAMEASGSQHVSLEQYRDQWLVLFFYPRDFTFVCPTEILGFSDRLPELQAMNAEVLGVSTDSAFVHDAWVRTPVADGGLGALSYPLGVYFDVPHGLAGSVFLSSVIKHNVKAGYAEYAELFDLVFEERAIPVQEKSLRFADEIVRLCEELRIPTSLNGFGVKTEADLRLIIDNSMQLKAAFEQNPVPFGIKEIEETIYSLK